MKHTYKEFAGIDSSTSKSFTLFMDTGLTGHTFKNIFIIFLTLELPTVFAQNRYFIILMVGLKNLKNEGKIMIYSSTYEIISKSFLSFSSSLTPSTIFSKL